MNCDEARRLMHEVLDGEESAEPAELAAHVEVCSACAARWGELRLVESMARQSEPVAREGVPEGLHGRIMAGLEREERLGAPVMRRRSSVLRATVAAVAALLMVMVVSRPPREVPTQPDRVVASAEEIALPAVPSLTIPEDLLQPPRLLADAEVGIRDFGRSVWTQTGSAYRALASGEVGVEEGGTATP